MIKWRLLFVICMGFVLLSGCDKYQLEDSNSNMVSDNKWDDNMDTTLYDPNDTWAIYWYLCGSDLESADGAATDDLAEMMEVSLPDNVTVVIETGGASEWMNDFVDPSVNQRYVYQNSDIQLVDETEKSNMGDAKTFENFLKYCETNYSADHKILLFWNHGGGSVEGVSFDENYDFDALTLPEIQSTLEKVYPEKAKEFEVVGFDTCLMSTLDTANTFKEYASYMVASQELEPGNGWDYSAWLNVFDNENGTNGAHIGKVICDTYVEGCEIYMTEDEITLSVLDLSHTEELTNAFHEMGKEMLNQAQHKPSMYSNFARSAAKAENYGGNTEVDGYSNMVDLGSLVSNAKDLLPETSDKILKALSEVVIYKVNGEYRQNSSGLSVYYSYNGDLNEITRFGEITSNDEYVRFIEQSVTGGSMEAFQNVDETDTSDEFEIPVEITEDNYARITLDQTMLDAVKSVFFNLAYMDEEEDLLIFLGRDNDLYMDWETGVFEDNFRGVWGSIDGVLCYMEITQEEEEYNLYSVPVYINNEACVLRVSYDYEKDAYSILGARKESEEDSKMGDKKLIILKPGDQITPILYGTSLSDESEETYELEAETITVSESTRFEEMSLEDGSFAFMFEVVDLSNQSHDSEIVLFDSVDGEVEFYIEE